MNISVTKLREALTNHLVDLFTDDDDLMDVIDNIVLELTDEDEPVEDEE